MLLHKKIFLNASEDLRQTASHETNGKADESFEGSVYLFIQTIAASMVYQLKYMFLL